jgi:proteasome lid subunit RPN8/RPN11
VCGFVVERGTALEVVPVRNVVDLHHARDPAAFPRTSRDGYLMDPREQLRVYRELARSGGRVLAVWHSHVETDARLSRKDREDALLDGVPTVPGAEYLVFALRGGRAGEARRYRLRGSEFVELPLAWPR